MKIFENKIWEFQILIIAMGIILKILNSENKIQKEI
jgi:hypothetical protein